MTRPSLLLKKAMSEPYAGFGCRHIRGQAQYSWTGPLRDCFFELGKVTFLIVDCGWQQGFTSQHNPDRLFNYFHEFAEIDLVLGRLRLSFP